MKKTLRTISLLLVLVMLASMLAGCTNKTEVVISVPGDQIGTELASIPVTVTVNGKPVDCRVEWQMLNETQDAYITASGVMENGNDYLAHVFYNAGAALGDENLDISVEGAELDYSEMAGEEIRTVVRINLLEKGNLTLVCGSVTLGAPIYNAYCAVKLDGENQPFNFQWTVTSGDETAPADANTVVEYGKVYELALEIYPEEGFNLNDWPVRVNCGKGDLVSIEQQGDVVYATIRYYYIKATVHEFFSPNVQIEVGSEQIGTALSEIPVTVQLFGENVPCRTEWSVMNDPADGYVPTSGTLEKGKDYLINVYYTADLTEEDLDADKIAVFGAELNHSEMAGEEILTVVRVNLLEKGNLTLTVGSHYVGMPIEHAYSVVKLDGEKLYSEHSWSIRKGNSEEAADESGYFEEGKYYQIAIRFIPPDDFDPDDWAIRLNCEGGELISLEADGAEYVAKIGFNYTNGEPPEQEEPKHECNFVLNPNKPSTATCAEAGVIFYLCQTCGAEKTETAAATGNHAWVEIDRMDLCDDGLTVSYSCSVCGQRDSEHFTSSHSWKETAREDLCDLGLTIYYTCEKCSATYNEVHASAHDWVKIDQAGYCPHGLQLVHECTKCGEIDTSQWIYPGDHSFGAAEYWSNHTHVRYCVECGHDLFEDHVTDNRGYCAACDSYIIN